MHLLNQCDTSDPLSICSYQFDAQPMVKTHEFSYADDSLGKLIYKTI